MINLIYVGERKNMHGERKNMHGKRRAEGCGEIEEEGEKEREAEKTEEDQTRAGGQQGLAPQHGPHTPTDALLAGSAPYSVE